MSTEIKKTTEKATEKTNKTENSQIKYRVQPKYGTYLEEDRMILQIALPGVQKQQIQMKALKDYFTLKARRGETLYTLDLDLGIDVEPEETKTEYTEGLLRVEFKRYNPLEHAYDVPIQ